MQMVFNKQKIMALRTLFVSFGFTLLELMIVLTILSTLIFATVESYNASQLKAKNEETIQNIKEIEIAIENFYIENGYQYPSSLSQIGMNNKLDPWGHPYNYLNIDALTNKGNDPKARKDKNLYPLNSDYDLYSMGPDGKTKISLTATESKDDVIRANNGGFVGVGADY